MSPDVPPSRTAIGATLRDARRRYGLEVREVEDRTKIRARYIRALENEDWETLPAPAYVRGFLRTYGQLLGLDGEMLADEFRRTYGEGPAGAAASGAGPAEPLLTERKRLGERPPSRAPLFIAILGGIALLVIVLIAIGGGDDEAPEPITGATEKPAGGGGKSGGGKGGGGDSDSERKPVDIELAAVTAVEVCLIAGGDEVLIDAQQLPEGATEAFEGYKNYELKVGPGNLDVTVGDASEQIEATELLAFEASSRGISQTEPQGDGCP